MTNSATAILVPARHGGLFSWLRGAHSDNHWRKTIGKAPLIPLAIAILTAGSLPSASAGPGTPFPVIDDHPAKIQYGTDAEITGHLENGSQGQVIALEEKLPDSKKWTEIDSKAVDKNLMATFVVQDLTTNVSVRLRFKESYSQEVTILVTAKLTLDVDPPDIMRYRKSTLSGILRPKKAGRSVVLERRVGGDWKRLDRLTSFGLRYEKTIEPETFGRGPVRAMFEGDEFNAPSNVFKRLWVYKPSLTTWYGPGFFGNRTACGQRLRRGTVGVAHRKLPCGTEVHVFYKGATITVDVIDRGPFTDANWDLTQEAAERINFFGKERLGYLVER